MACKKNKNKTKGISFEEKTKEDKTDKKTDELNKVFQEKSNYKLSEEVNNKKEKKK